LHNKTKQNIILKLYHIAQLITPKIYNITFAYL